MRKFISFLLLAVMLMSLLTACGVDNSAETTVATQPAIDLGEPLCDGTTLKILFIGNSFSDDVNTYLYDVLTAEGVTNIVLGKLYYGGCTIKRHAGNAANDIAEYTYSRNTSGVWEKTENATMLFALKNDDWDIISLQQASTQSGVADSYNEDLDALITYVNENKTNPDAKLVWHMTWAYQSDSTHSSFPTYGNDQMNMYNMTCDAVQQQIETRDVFSAIIPVGTAIQNARTSYFGDTLTRDGFHLNDFGKLIGSYTWYAALTGKTLETINLNSLSEWFTLSDSNKAVVIEAVNGALENPYSVTQSTLTE